MNTNNIALRTAVVIALGSVPAVASATLFSPSNPVILAREIAPPTGALIRFSSTDVPSHALTLSITNLKGRTIDTNFPFELRLTLTNGATFSSPAAGDLACNYSAADGTPAAKVADSVLQGADNKLVFKLQQGRIATESPICVFSGLVNMTSGSKGGDASYDMSSTAYIYSTVSPNDNAFETVQGSIVTFRQAYQMGVSPSSTTIDVSSPSFSMKFAGGLTAASMGNLKYTSVNGYNNKVVAGVITQITSPAVDVLPGSSEITLSGTPLQSQGTVIIGWDGNACDDAITMGTNAKTASVSGTVSFSVVAANAAGVADGLVDADGTSFCYIVDGGTKLSKGLVTFDVTTPTNSTQMPNVSVAGDKTIAKFFKNGSSMKVLTIPDPTDLNNPFNIRIYNMGASESGIYGTLYNVKGERLGTANLPLATLKAGAVKVLTTAQLASAFGVASWGGGRAWMQIEGDSQQIRVQALAKTNGVVVNMSDRVMEDNGTTKRSSTQ